MFKKEFVSFIVFEAEGRVYYEFYYDPYKEHDEAVAKARKKIEEIIGKFSASLLNLKKNPGDLAISSHKLSFPEGEVVGTVLSSVHSEGKEVNYIVKLTLNKLASGLEQIVSSFKQSLNKATMKTIIFNLSCRVNFDSILTSGDLEIVSYLGDSIQVKLTDNFDNCLEEEKEYIIKINKEESMSVIEISTYRIDDVLKCIYQKGIINFLDHIFEKLHITVEE